MPKSSPNQLVDSLLALSFTLGHFGASIAARPIRPRASAEFARRPSRRRRRRDRRHHIPLDELTSEFLARGGRTLDSVPQAGEVVYMRSTANISTGGTPIDRTDAIHPDNAAICAFAADAVGLDVAGIDGGDAHQQRTIIPVEAHARFNMRLAPSQDFDAMKAELERLLRAAAPENADVEFAANGEIGAVFDASAPAIQLASKALEEACGKETALIRSGGSIGALAGFARRGIPCVLTGFTLVDDALHAPNESYRLESLRLGEEAARLRGRHGSGVRLALAGAAVAGGGGEEHRQPRMVAALEVVAVQLARDGPAAGLAAAALLIPHPLSIYLSSLAGSDGLVTLFVAWATLAAMALALTSGSAYAAPGPHITAAVSDACCTRAAGSIRNR
mgnify:CR=1 FL=1